MSGTCHEEAQGRVPEPLVVIAAAGRPCVQRDRARPWYVLKRRRDDPIARRPRPEDSCVAKSGAAERAPAFFGSCKEAGMNHAEFLHTRPSPKRLPLIRSEEHTSELQSLMRISYAVFCLK